MIKIKNLRPGILIIADAGLKLAPGESRDVDELTPQAREAIANKLLARIDAAEPQAESKPKTAAKPAEKKAESKKPAGKKTKTEEAPAETENNGEQSAETGDSGQGQLIGAEDGSGEPTEHASD